MWVFSKPLEALSGQDLRALIENQVRENSALEFKSLMYGRSDADIREMLRDISSIANAEGGIIVVGLKEDADGIAAALEAVPNAEVEAARLVSSCLANIAERLPGLRAVPVPLQQRGSAIVVSISRSYRKPHMVTFPRGRTEFWIRHDRQKSPMSIAEIRSAILATEELQVRAERLIEQRYRALSGRSHELHLGITGTPLIIEEGRVDTSSRPLHNLLKSPPTSRPVVGVALSDPSAEIRATLRGVEAIIENVQSLEVFRSGHIEFWCRDLGNLSRETLGDGRIVISGWALAEYIWNFVDMIRALREVTLLSDPYLITVALWHCRGVVMPRGGAAPQGRRINEWTEDENLLLPPTLATLEEEPDTMARRICDLLWNAFHHAKCPFFDAEGKFSIPNY